MANSRVVAKVVAAIGLSVVVAASLVWVPAAAAVPSVAQADVVVATVESGLSPEMGDYAISDYAEQVAELPTELLDALSDTGLTGAEYLAQGDAATDAAAVVDALDQQLGDTVLGARMDGTDLIVNVASEADVASVEQTGAIAEVGAPVAPELNLEGATFAQDLDGGEPYGYNFVGGGFFYCSVGFNGFEVSTGASRFATAGHCEPQNKALPVQWLQGASYIVPTTPSASIGTPVAGSYEEGNGYDIGLVNVNSALPRAWVAKPGVVTSAPGAAKTTTVVRDQAEPIVGALVCKSGATTGWSCGEILQLAYADLGTDAAPILVASIVTNACVNAGDSGGTLLMGMTAVGITSWATNVESCAGPDYLSGFSVLIDSNPIIETAAKKYAGTWEPAVAVDSPAVAAPAASAVVSPTSSIGGSLVAGNTRHRVEIYFDGSSVPVTVAVTTAGAWSASLAALAPGIHTYQVRARWGTWSMSGLSAPVTFQIQGASISGRVTGPVNVNLSGICVDAVSAGVTRGSATTGAAGTYSISNLPAGTYTLHFIDCPTGGSIYEDRWWNNKDTQGVADTFVVSVPSAVVDKDIALNLAGPFLDVRNSHPFATQIAWMSSAGISTGSAVTGGFAYRPAEAVSRGAMAAFLYRLAGSPAVSLPVTPTFADVPDTHPFYKNIEWMFATGISTGSASSGSLLYKPAAPVSREAMSAFLNRLFLHQGFADDFVSPSVASFTDVPPDANFFRNIEWMRFSGISTGYNEGGGLLSYRPSLPVTRAAMAAFLSRYDALP